MKCIIVALVIVGLLVPVASAQEPEQHHVYLPWISSMPRQICNRPWRLIEPEGSTNLVLNPSAEMTGNYAAAGGGVVARVTTYQHYGLYSYHVTTAANTDGIDLTTPTLAATAHFVTLRVHGTMPPSWVIVIGWDSKTPRLIERIDEDWALYGIEFSAAQAGGFNTVSILQDGAGAGDFYVDGVQVEALGHWTTYIDGTQPGCSWNGAEHAATSTRSAAARTGGRPRDFQQNYGLFIEEMVGTGTPPVTLDVRGYSLLPGGELAGSKIEPREFSLIGTMSASSKQELHAKRQRLTEAILGAGGQEVRLEYMGASAEKYIDAIYMSGLEAQLPVTYDGTEVIDEGWQNTNTYEEKLALQFSAPDPAFYAIGESAAALDTNDTATFRIVGSRLKDTEQWDELGPPNAAGTYTQVWAIAEDATYVYVAGNFLNFDNVGNADRIARWHKANQTWDAVGVGLNATVRAMAVGPDGKLYIGGFFTDIVGGIGGTYNYVIAWDPATSTWSALGVGMDNTVYSLVFGLDGTLYAGGDFLNAGGGAANRVAAWDGAAWSALGAGTDGTVKALAIAPDGSLFAGGGFANAGGNPAAYIAKWDGAAWSALGAGMNNTVDSLAMSADGVLYAGGTFTTAGGVSANRIAKWNGTAWSTLGTGMNNSIYCLEIAPDGILYAGGVFTSAGGIVLADRIAGWNGASWFHLDIDFPGAPIVSAIWARNSDPVISSKYDLWVGFNTSGTGSFAGLVTATNDGSSPAYPKIVFERAGGTSATVESVRNETLGLALLLNYGLLDGERLTIDLAPTAKSIVSSMFGPRPDAILANSDFGAWNLKAGSDSDVSSFVAVAGGPTVTGYMLWKSAYSSLD